MDQVAILLDGGFVKKRLSERLGRFPNTPDVVALTQAVMGHDRLTDCRLFRVFYYDAPPFEGSNTHPLTKQVVNFSTSVAAQRNKALIDDLELQPDFAVRRGQVANRGWKLGRDAIKALKRGPARAIQARDLIPDMEQKGVDLRIGLDIATISLRNVVDILVLVSGDSDLVPAMKFARAQGLKVYLEVMGNPMRRELRAHADYVL